MRKLLVVLLSFCMIFIFTACSSEADGGEKDKVVVSGKKFTEQILLSEILAQILQARTDLNIVHQKNLDGTALLHSAMQNGDIDIYYEYTGTGYMSVLEHEYDLKDPEEMYKQVNQEYNEKFNMSWLEPLAYNSTYVLAMREEQAEELGITTFSDLVEHAPNLIFASDANFHERPDGFSGLTQEYGFEFKDAKKMDLGLMYQAARDGHVDVINAISTDSRIPKLNLKMLEDDKNYFPPYYGAPVIRNEVLEKHPEIADVLNELAPHLTLEKIVELSALVDVDQEKPEDVVRQFLIEEGLIEG